MWGFRKNVAVNWTLMRWGGKDRNARNGTKKERGCRTKNGVAAPFSCEKHKSQTTKNPAFAVKYIYATK